MSKPGRPELVVIFGPQAVGKMTVGQELERITDFRLFHNHRTIDLVTDYFEFGTREFETVTRTFLGVFFEEAAKAGKHIIFTLGWRFDVPDDAASIKRKVEPFLRHGGEAHFVELAAPLAVRLERNETPNRRAHKKTDWATREHLAALAAAHRWSSDGAFPYPAHHLLLDTTNLPAAEAAACIKARFDL